MLNIMQNVRKQIADTGKMKSPKLKAIFLMKDEDQADQELLKLARKQVQLKEALVLPWVTAAPLLLENEAITAFTAKNPDWKAALPEILTVAEASQVAQVNYLLNATQTAQMIESLKRPLSE